MEVAYRPTFFEQVTAIALLAFAEAKVELAILATGSVDASTRAPPQKPRSPPSPASTLDHQEYLGKTIEKSQRRRRR